MKRYSVVSVAVSFLLQSGQFFTNSRWLRLFPTTRIIHTLVVLSMLATSLIGQPTRAATSDVTSNELVADKGTTAIPAAIKILETASIGDQAGLLLDRKNTGQTAIEGDMLPTTFTAVHSAVKETGGLTGPAAEAVLAIPEYGNPITSTWHLTGSAITDTYRIVLTEDLDWQSGAAWSAEQVDLREDFKKAFMVNLGDDDGGADGIVFAFQQEDTGALGSPGYGIGYGGDPNHQIDGYHLISPSLGIEMDTYYNSQWDPEAEADHMAIDINGYVNHNRSGNSEPVEFGVDVEDDQEHLVRVEWIASASTLFVFWDHKLFLSYAIDDLTAIFDEDAFGAVEVWYGFTAGTGVYDNRQYFYEIPYETGVPPRSTLCSGENDGCPGSPFREAQETEGGPINTLTGGYDYTVQDLSIQTSAGPLAFQRTYSSLATELYTTTLSYGWTHNLDTRLIFPDDPGGLPGVVFFKAHTANQYQFYKNTDGSFSSYPGLCATLVQQGDEYIIQDKAQHTYIFDEDGNLSQYQDPQSHTLTYEYNNDGLLEEVRDETSDKYIRISYDDGRISDVKSSVYIDGKHYDRQVNFSYDASGNLYQVTDVMGKTWTYYYEDANHPHFLTAVVDPLGIVVEATEYDQQGRAVRQYQGGEYIDTQTWPAPLIELDYHADGTTEIAKLVDGTMYTSTHTYDAGSRLIADEDPQGNSSGKTYNSNLRSEMLSDPLDNTTRLTWSANGNNLERMVDAASYTTTMHYDGLNNLTVITDTRGYTTSYSYDDTLLESSTDALEETIIYTYTTVDDDPQPPGLLKAVEDPLGNVTTYVYDEYGQRISMTDPVSRTTTYDYRYDEKKELYWMVVTDQQDRSNWTCYDAADRVVRTVTNASDPNDNPCDKEGYTPSTDPAYDLIQETVYDGAGKRIASIDPVGRVTRTYYDERGYAVKVVQNLQSGWDIFSDTPPTCNRDTTGLATPHNICTEVEYDDAGRAIATIDPLGRSTRTYFDALGHPYLVFQNWDGQADEAADCNRYQGATTNICNETFYDEGGNVIATRDARGVYTRTYYDTLNRQSLVVQNLTSQGYLEETRPQWSKFGNDHDVASEMVYDQAGNTIITIEWLVVETQVVSRSTRTYYDALNRPDLVFQNWDGQANEAADCNRSSGAATNICTETVYNEGGNRIESIDPLGRSTRIYYDDLGRPDLVFRNWDGQASEAADCNRYTGATTNICTETKYDQGGNAIATIDPQGGITRTYFDVLGRVRYVVQNLVGQDIEVNSPPAYDPDYPDHNVRTETIYDVSGRMAQTIDVLDGVMYTCYDDLGRVTKTVANPTVTDPCDSYTASQDADRDIITRFTYDVAGKRLKRIDPDQTETLYQYDSLNRLVSVTDPLENTTSYVYDVNGNRVQTTDAEEVVTTYVYDPLTRLVSVVENYDPPEDPDHETNLYTQYSYNAFGQRLVITDALTHTTSFNYDLLGRLVSESDALGHTWQYGYDVVGNRVVMTDANGAATNYVYDLLDRLEKINYDYEDPQPDVEVTFNYNILGWRTAMTDSVGVTAWIYDDLGRPLEVSDPFSDTVAYVYNGTGKRLNLTYPDMEVVTYTYDLAGRLETVTDWDTNVTSYTYDKSGRLLSTTLPNEAILEYTYEDNGWLKKIDIDAQRNGYIDYHYDDVGNRTQAKEDLATEQADILYTYDALYRLEEADYKDRKTRFVYEYDEVGNRQTYQIWDDHDPIFSTDYLYDTANRLVAADSVSYTWDNNGNLLHDGVYTNTYDLANRLIAVSDEQTTVSAYEYNGLGDRLIQTTGGMTTTYTLDLAAGLTQVLDDGEHLYLYGLGRIAQYSDTETEYFVSDALGSVRMLLDEDGEATLESFYKPYGEALESIGDSASVYGFTGEATDVTGLVYLRARYYSPGQGRFISRDVWDGDVYTPMSYNKWVYTNNNPTNYTDPWGLCLDEDLDGICDRHDYRDLTDWLYREMIHNAKGPEVRRWQMWNKIWKGWTAIGVTACGVGFVSGQPVIIVGGGVVIVGGTVFHASALYEYGNAVKNGANWDFKDEIGLGLGPGITLCTSSQCYNDIEYSVPGNIHFSYIGAAAGILGVEIQAGAGYAEISDPAHDPSDPEYVGPYVGPNELQDIFGETWWDPNTWNFGDEAIDHEAVTMGIKLWKKYEDRMTLGQFRSELGKYVGGLSRCSPNSYPVQRSVSSSWPYPIGYFDNRGEDYQPPDRCR